MEAVNLRKKECKIVVAVDESEESMYALSWCLGNLISQNTTNTLVLLYVKPPPTVYSSFDAAGYMFFIDVITALEKYGSDLVNSVMGRAEALCGKFSGNINVERIVGSGDAKDVICNTVEKIKADTLVMGSHGYGFFKRALLGSVSDHCAKNVKCPVVIVKHPEKI
ncbi:universal stress protein PHOS34-like [Durio zibethinus]|uniref:Universal stress protein PHOS34-like n=1 Tax=Durio zibethinus TaxID=66656 RepID=A0A6P5ZZH2_DURZI|nr:universal stress protein PHOS34-like [Durio zibethinus]